MRIVSLSPATTEILYVLGAQDRLIANTSDCNYPAAAQRKPRVGKFGAIDAERLLGLKPDLVLATGEMAPKLTGLRHLPCPVLAIETPTLRSIADAVSAVGDATGQASQAARWRRQWLARVEAVERDRLSQGPTAFFVLWPDPLMTVSDRSFIGDLLRTAGARNLAAGIGNPYPVFSWETLLAGKPDWLIYTSSLGDKQLQGGRWSMLPVVRAGRLVKLDRDLIERSGPRAIDALETLHRTFKRGASAHGASAL